MTYSSTLGLYVQGPLTIHSSPATLLVPSVQTKFLKALTLRLVEVLIVVKVVYGFRILSP